MVALFLCSVFVTLLAGVSLDVGMVLIIRGLLKKAKGQVLSASFQA
jgi:hypothetical protein